jgi:hypothetical protein
MVVVMVVVVVPARFRRLIRCTNGTSGLSETLGQLGTGLEAWLSTADTW